jgi:hypothetical protein
VARIVVDDCGIRGAAMQLVEAEPDLAEAGGTRYAGDRIAMATVRGDGSPSGAVGGMLSGDGS